MATHARRKRSHPRADAQIHVATANATHAQAGVAQRQLHNNQSCSLCVTDNDSVSTTSPGQAC
eukprot:10208917-Karenia_brevis.AAC.1